MSHWPCHCDKCSIIKDPLHDNVLQMQLLQLMTQLLREVTATNAINGNLSVFAVIGAANLCPRTTLSRSVYVLTATDGVSNSLKN